MNDMNNEQKLKYLERLNKDCMLYTLEKVYDSGNRFVSRFAERIDKIQEGKIQSEYEHEIEDLKEKIRLTEIYCDTLFDEIEESGNFILNCFRKNDFRDWRKGNGKL